MIEIGPITLHEGKCEHILPTLNANSYDSIVCDPPYGLNFMGKSWDHGVPSTEVWKEVLRVLKPGGYLLAFAGSRTYHRMAVNIEDAGFEIRDQIMWVYGSGFPKSLDVSKALDKMVGVEREVVAKGNPVKRMIPGADQDRTGSWIKDNGRVFVPTVTLAATEAAQQWKGWGTALKPAHEPIVVARKPLIGTVAANVLEWGVGGLNIDGCRVETDDVNTSEQYAYLGDNGNSMGAASERLRRNGGSAQSPLGRFPTNLIHDGSDEVMACFPNAPGQQGNVSATAPSDKTSNVYGHMRREGEPSADSENQGTVGFKMKPGARRIDSGSAARFFYCAKASKSDRGEGNDHPTVKPQSLMRYLCRLVTPPNGLILDPYAGSGSTGLAAATEGFRSTLIEEDNHNLGIACVRSFNLIYSV